MDNILLARCEQFIKNKQISAEVFPWDGGLIHLCCAGIYSAEEKTADVNMLKNCKDLLKEKVGFFSNFRSYARSPIAAILAADGRAEELLEQGLFVYELLKKEFYGSSYLPIAAMIIASMAQPTEYERIAEKTRKIYELMKKDHPFLTTAEDSGFCALLALSDKTPEELVQDSEQCYQILKGSFFSANSIQSLCHVLALCEGSPEYKCRRTMELYQLLKDKGCKYGTQYELPTLGVAALSQESLQARAEAMIEVDQWLSGQKGFGFFGAPKKQRLMYAGILTQPRAEAAQTLQTASVSGTIALVIAQQAAMCAAIAASSAAAASAASSS